MEQIQLSLSQNRRNIKCNQKDSLFVSVNLSLDESTQLIKQSHHVSLAIDCSGSMYGEPLDDAKNAALEAIRSLSPDTLVSIVAFETEAKIILSARSANDPNISEVINSLEDGGGTAMYDGIDMAFNSLQNHPDSDMIKKLMLFTDGEPTVGPDDNEIIKRCKEIRNQGISVDVFGIGIDYNENLTKSISEAGGGTWEHVENTKDLQETVMLQMTELEKTVIVNPQLEITLMNGAELSAAAMIRPTYKKIDLSKYQMNGNKVVFGIKDIIIDQSQTIAMRISIPPLQTTQPTPLVTARILKKADEVIAVATATIACSDDPEIYGLITDPNPTADFQSGLATAFLQDGIKNNDDEKTKLGKTIIANLKKDAEKGNLSQETQVAVKNVQELGGFVTSEMSEAEKKEAMHQSTKIGAPSSEPTSQPEPEPQPEPQPEQQSQLTFPCPNCAARLKRGAKFCGKCGKPINKQEDSQS